MAEHHGMSEEAMANLCNYLNSAHYYITRDEIRAAMRGDFAKPLPAPPIPPMSEFLSIVEGASPMEEKVLALKLLFRGASYHPTIEALINDCAKAVKIVEEDH